MEVGASNKNKTTHSTIVSNNVSDLNHPNSLIKK